ncbi:MAG: Lar family restriction alleviation protein [Ruminococcus flavefaciens]|nr:Lar family restriction alleviation protein [Ruminococcus flavefaciens]
MNEIKLKPCPFCGGEAVICKTTTNTSDLEKTIVCIVCLKCYCAPFHTEMQNLCDMNDREEILENMEREVAENWNRRTNNETD